MEHIGNTDETKTENSDFKTCINTQVVSQWTKQGVRGQSLHKYQEVREKGDHVPIRESEMFFMKNYTNTIKTAMY